MFHILHNAGFDSGCCVSYGGIGGISQTKFYVKCTPRIMLALFARGNGTVFSVSLYPAVTCSVCLSRLRSFQNLDLSGDDFRENAPYSTLAGYDSGTSTCDSPQETLANFLLFPRETGGCSTSANSTSASWPKSNWPKSKLAEVEQMVFALFLLFILFLVFFSFFFSFFFFFFFFFFFLFLFLFLFLLFFFFFFVILLCIFFLFCFCFCPKNLCPEPQTLTPPLDSPSAGPPLFSLWRSRGILVVFEASGHLNVHVWALGLSCEIPAAFCKMSRTILQLICPLP